MKKTITVLSVLLLATLFFTGAVVAAEDKQSMTLGTAPLTTATVENVTTTLAAVADNATAAVKNVTAAAKNVTAAVKNVTAAAKNATSAAKNATSALLTANGGALGGDSGMVHIHTNVPGAKVTFYLINVATTHQSTEEQYADENGDVYFKVYSTATPPKSAIVTAPGYIQDSTSQIYIEAPANGEMITYNVELKPINPTQTVKPTKTATPVPTTTPAKSPAPVVAVLAALGLAGVAAALRRN